jgi:hypothetical protein
VCGSGLVPLLKVEDDVVGKLMSPSDDVKFALERYNDIVKLRAAQVLALFLVYSLSIKESKELLDGASVLALSIPIFAWVFDVIARRQYLCPYAYAIAAYAYQEVQSADAGSVANSMPSLVLDFAKGPRSEAFRLFKDVEDDEIRQHKFKEWFTWKDQSFAVAIFFAFFLIALAATGAFDRSADTSKSVPAASAPAAMNE